MAYYEPIYICVMCSMPKESKHRVVRNDNSTWGHACERHVKAMLALAQDADDRAAARDTL